MNIKKIAKNSVRIFLYGVLVFLIITIFYLNKGKSFCEVKTIILAGLQKDGQISNALSNPDYIKSVCK